MMGMQPEERQPEFFSYHIHLERRIRPDHPLRQLKAALDLSFVIPLVKASYGLCGNTSLDPRVILKLMILLFYYDVTSERELMAQLPERLDWLWFLDFDLDTQTPHHSVLSKARTRWGTEVFETLFMRSVEQCVKAGLVDGRLLHADSTVIKANASKDSIVKSGPELVAALRKAYQKEEQKLILLPSPTAAPEPPPAADQKEPARKGPSVNQTHVSRTDPEAELTRTKNGNTELSYKEHRMVDDAKGVITAVIATAGSVGDASQLPGLLSQHKARTSLKLDSVTVAGDHHYGSADNYLYCAHQGIRAHLAPTSAQLKARGLFAPQDFVYEPKEDRLLCPAGHYLALHQHRAEEQIKVYVIEDSKLCAQCPLQKQCTNSTRGRSVKRHWENELLEKLRSEAQGPAARYSRKRRKHVMEGSFADGANNHGLKRSRWRGLRRQRVQGWLIAMVQNLRLLRRNMHNRPRQPGANVLAHLKLLPEVIKLLSDRIYGRIGYLYVSRGQGPAVTGRRPTIFIAVTTTPGSPWKKPVEQHARKEADKGELLDKNPPPDVGSYEVWGFSEKVLKAPGSVSLSLRRRSQAVGWPSCCSRAWLSRPIP
jgi:transposase